MWQGITCFCICHLFYSENFHEKKKKISTTFCFGRWHLIARISNFFSDETSQWRVLFTEPHWFLWRILRRVFTRRLSATLSWNRNWTTRNHWPSWYNDSKTKQKVFDASKYHILRWRGVKIKDHNERSNYALNRRKMRKVFTFRNAA